MQRVVNIVLKDETLLKRCVIFKEGGRGDIALNDVEAITEKFRIMPWGNEWRVIPFQTTKMNGFIPVQNVQSYEIYEVEEF